MTLGSLGADLSGVRNVLAIDVLAELSRTVVENVTPMIGR